MDRRFFLALLVCLAFTFLLQIGFDRFGPKRLPKPMPPQKATSSERVARGGASDTSRTSPRVPSVPTDARKTGEIPPDWLPAHGAERLDVDAQRIRLTVSSTGGRLTRAALPEFALPSGDVVDLLRNGESRADLSMTLVLDGRGMDLSTVPFSLEAVRDAGGVITGVRAVAQHRSGLRIERTIEVARDYEMQVRVRVSGVPSEIREASYSIDWVHGLPIVERNANQDESSFAVSSTVGTDFRQEHVRDFGKSKEHVHEGNVQWVGVRTKYFTCAVIPPKNAATRLVATGDKDLKVFGFRLPLPVLPGQETEHSFRMYVGPIDHKLLENFGVGADRMASLGWTWTAPLAKLLLWCLVKLYELVPNYGIGIIIVSALTRLIFYPLTQSSFKSMAAMQRIQPQMQEIQKKYKSNPERLNKETMALFRDNKVNPLGGCIPMLVQMPVFVALFGVLSGAVQLRGAHFGLWIKDLSSPDVVGAIAGLPIHILPLVMTATSLWQAKMTPTDPRQAAMTYMMPVVMMFMFYSFPAGTVLYWTVNNIMTIAQQYAMRMHVAPASAPPGAVAVQK